MNRQNDRFVIDPGRVTREGSKPGDANAWKSGAGGGSADRPECGAGRPRPRQHAPSSTGLVTTASDASPVESIGERILRLAQTAATMHIGMAVDPHHQQPRPQPRGIAGHDSTSESEVA